MSKYFSLEKKDGVWWLKDPQGKRMFYTSVQCVGPKDGSIVKGSPVYDGIKLYGSEERWAEATEKRLRAWGFKGLGAWNSWSWHQRSLPFTESLNIWKSLQRDGGLKPIYDRDWEAMAGKAIRERVAKLKALPGLVGYFLDNEIPWPLDTMRRYFDRNPAGDPNRKAVVDFLRRRYGKVEALNQAWHLSLGSYEALARMPKLPAHPDLSRADALAFLGQVARQFFVTASRLVRQADPGRLILGARHAGMPAWEVIAAQAGATDVMSINVYRPEADLPQEDFYKAHLLSGGQPLWITEFSFHAPFDNRSGNRNRIGFGARVRGQEARAKGYASLVGQAASLPFFVGTDWFQFHDEPPEGRGGDGEDVNFGLVDMQDRPYEKLIASVRRTNFHVDALHRASARWRLNPAAAVYRPCVYVPKAGREASPILEGLRFRPSMDKLPTKPPVQARLSWTPQALKVQVDVKCRQRTTDLKNVKRSIEWFWMSDAVEVLLRPESPEGSGQALDDASLKVWAIPDGSGKGRPFVGAWRRHKRVEGRASGVQVSQRSLPGGYGIDFSIPASLVQKGPWKAWQQVRFNLLVEDCRQVTEVCWADHQGNWTTERPLTWGVLKLVG
jgi:hypothetical protein